MQVKSGEHFSVFRSKTMKTTSRLLIGVSCIAAAMTAPAFAQDATAEADDSASSSEIVVTGSRGQGRTVISSPTPIDVLGGEDLEKPGGGIQLPDALTQLVPSFQSTTVGRSSFNSLTRPAGLRERKSTRLKSSH